MPQNRRYEDACDFLKENKLRYSRQRMVVVSELFFNDYNQKHFKLNDLLDEIENNHKNVNISSASLANILKGLCSEGHIREVYVNKAYYDTDVRSHMHFYDTIKDELINIDESGHLDYIINNVQVPEGYNLKGVKCILEVDKD